MYNHNRNKNLLSRDKRIYKYWLSIYAKPRAAEKTAEKYGMSVSNVRYRLRAYQDYLGGKNAK